MIDRKKKLRFIQICLLLIGTLIILFTYTNRNKSFDDKILTEETQEKIKKQFSQQNQDGDIFFNIEYSGFDLEGNRYILKSKEASNSKSNQEIVNMKGVQAVFYFKDDTVLNVSSKRGTYNNKTLDMNFYESVNANYGESQLFAEKAEYSNSKSFLIISENVKVKDIRGTMVADRLLFDIKKQTLNIESFNEGKINANINLKWKKDLEY